MQSVITKHLPKTKTLGTRILAKTPQGDKIQVPFNQDLDVYENHRAAAAQLVKKLQYRKQVSYAITDTTTGYIFTPIEKASFLQ